MNDLSPEKISELISVLDWGKAVSLLLGFATLFLVVRLIRFLVKSFQDQLPSHRIRLAQLQAILTYFTYIFGGGYLLYITISPTREVMLAITGSAAVAIGFSLKDLVASVVAGFILIMDRPFQVGDRITHGETYGDVVSIGLRAIRVRTLDDNMVTIPNSKFITESVASGNDGAIDMLVTSRFYFPEATDLTRLRDDLYEIVATSKYVYLKKEIAISMNEKILEKQVVIEVTIKAYVLDFCFEKALDSDLTIRVQQYKTALRQRESEARPV